jgi:glycosyl transferase family 87
MLSRLGCITPMTAIRRIFIIAGIASLSISYLLIWHRFVHDPAERTGLDFIAFYAAGRIAQQAGAAHVYDLRLQQEIQQEEVGFRLVPGQVLPYIHMPFLIPVLQLLVGRDYVTSLYRWASLQLVVYALGIAVLSRCLRHEGIDRDAIAAAALGGLLFLPGFFSFVTGQDTAFLFFGVAVWVCGLISRRETLSGIGLSLATVRPHIALIVALPMLFRHREVFWAFTVASAALATFSFVIVGIEGSRQFIDILRLSAGGTWYGMKEDSMYNLIGLLTRAFPGLSPELVRATGWFVYGAALVGLCVLWSRARNPKAWLIGPTVALALFVAPHLHFHDLTLLLIPIHEVIRSSARTGMMKTGITATFPIAASLLLLLSNVCPDLRYKTPYLIMLTLAGYPLLREIQPAVRLPRES